MTRSSAPGKIVLCGEYAVLRGAPAIGMAIDRRARVEVDITGSDFHTVETRGHVSGQWRFREVDDIGLEWLGGEPPAGSLDLLRPVLRTIRVDRGLSLAMDTGGFYDSRSGVKLGLGSSAALTSALVTALCHATGQAADLEAKAMASHRQFQNGRGSGVDIATSLAGGIIGYRMEDPHSGRPLTWPVDLKFAVLWSGRAASTVEKLDLLADAAPAGRRDASVARLCRASEQTLAAWSSGHTAEVLEAFRRYVDALGRFDIDHGLGIFDAGHEVLAEAAAESGLIYKPCGAGGGDVGIVLGTEQRAIAGFVRRAETKGFSVLDVNLDAHGAMLEKE